MPMTSTERSAKYRAGKRRITVATTCQPAIDRLVQLSAPLGSERAAIEYALTTCPPLAERTKESLT